MRRFDPLHPRLTRTFVSLALLLPTVLVVSCQGSSGFGDFGDTNLIENRDFNATDGDGDPLWQPDDATGRYMTWELETAVAPPSGTNGPVYRMEVVNLFQNGDFEAFAPGAGVPTNWAQEGNANAEIVEALDGQALRLAFEGTDVRLYLDLAGAGGLQDGTGASAFGGNREYTIHFDYVPTVTDIGIELNNNVQADSTGTGAGNTDQFRVAIEAAQTGTRLEFPNSITSPPLNTLSVLDGEYSYFNIGGFTTTAQARFAGEIDNIRFVELGRSYYIRLPVPYSESGRPDLVPGGTYTVSLQVRLDPDVGTVNNRLAARQIAVGIVGSEAISSGAVSADVLDTRDVDTGWTQLSVEIPGPTFPSVEFDGEDTMLFVAISPTFTSGGAQTTDAGSVLVSDPRLFWSPN
ncbi:MAG: hypothetical protein ACOC28_07210 [Alkalispirochaetaceae bacterium]